MKQIKSFLLLFLLTLSFSIYGQDLSLNISGLEDLGANYQYEGWVIVNGMPVTTGTFTVDGSGILSQTSFSVDLNDLIDATAFVLTIEPIPDSDPNPSSVHILGGSFMDFDAPLSVGHPAALGDDFSSIDGNYILATPTNGAMTNELSGIWFLDISSGTPSVGLTLPTLPSGWKYEGWVVINGTPVTSGTFTAIDMVDDADPYSGMDPGPPFPGEDFLMNAPSGLTFPTDLSGMTGVISIEPDPDNSVAPFLLKPLVGSIPAGAVDHTTYAMNSNVLNSFPTGTATRSAVVPVELTNFQAKLNSGIVLLNWATATETNNSKFEIERKAQGTDNDAWKLIGIVDGNGTTSESHSYSYSDDISKLNSSSLSYRLKQIDFNGEYEYSNEIYVDNIAPAEFKLGQNYPNPFNPSTKITFGLPSKNNVLLKVYNSLGSEVATLVNDVREAGNYEIEFNANNFSSGIYFYKIQVGGLNSNSSNNFTSIRKMILLK